MSDTQPKPNRQKDPTKKPSVPSASKVPEIGGQKGPDPTRYGDWEKGGRCTDF